VILRIALEGSVLALPEWTMSNHGASGTTALVGELGRRFLASRHRGIVYGPKSSLCRVAEGIDNAVSEESKPQALLRSPAGRDAVK